MNYYFSVDCDTSARRIEIISMGMVSEKGKTLYVKNSSADFDLHGEWVKKNLHPLTDQLSCVDHYGSVRTVRTVGFGTATHDWYHFYKFKDLILKLIGADSNPVFYSSSGPIGWTAITQVFDEHSVLPESFNDMAVLEQMATNTLGTKFEYMCPNTSNLKARTVIDRAWVVKNRYDELISKFHLSLEKKW